MLEKLLKCMGDVIELPEEEIGMGSELVSCMPGFISAIFDVISNSAKKHTAIVPKVTDELFEKTLDKRSQTAKKEQENFRQ